MDLKLKGNNALITGGTKGIGRAIADALADEGCNVAICARTDADVQQAVKALQSKGVKAFGQAVDVGNGDQLKAWVQASAEALGGIDCLVSNVSGGNAPGEAGWRANFEHDVLGTVRLVEQTLPFLEKFIGANAYNAMKAAMIQYAGALAQDLGPKGIRVNSVCPGPIFIEGGAWDKIKQGMKAFYDQTVAAIPLGRLGLADDVAAQVALLASPRGSFTTGANLVIDGGFTKRIQF